MPVALNAASAALARLNLRAIHATGYAFQVELAYNFWRSGFAVREVPITFVDRRVGKSKMSRKIFAEAFLWVLRTRLTGDAAVRRPAAPGEIVSPGVAPGDARSTSPALPAQVMSHKATGS